MTTKNRLNQTIERFTDALILHIRAEIHEELLGALSKRIGVKTAASTRNEASLAKGEKRSPEALHRLELQLHQFIKRRPGLGIEAIARDMKVLTRELALPVKKLIAARQVTTKGHKRSTKYFARD